MRRKDLAGVILTKIYQGILCRCSFPSLIRVQSLCFVSVRFSQFLNDVLVHSNDTCKFILHFLLLNDDFTSKSVLITRSKHTHRCLKLLAQVTVAICQCLFRSNKRFQGIYGQFNDRIIPSNIFLKGPRYNSSTLGGENASVACHFIAVLVTSHHPSKSTYKTCLNVT